MFSSDSINLFLQYKIFHTYKNYKLPKILKKVFQTILTFLFNLYKNINNIYLRFIKNNSIFNNIIQ